AYPPSPAHPSLRPARAPPLRRGRDAAARHGARARGLGVCLHRISPRRGGCAMKESMNDTQAIERPGVRTDVDVVVIGGGVNGSGVARDCTQRGLSVAVFERNDIAFGASGNNSGMIHGGPRYLTYDPDVT